MPGMQQNRPYYSYRFINSFLPKMNATEDIHFLRYFHGLKITKGPQWKCVITRI